MADFLGAKTASGAYQAIIAAMPPHDTYIETHLGTGAVMKFKAPALRSVGIELDPQTLAEYEPPYPLELHHGDCLAYLGGGSLGELRRPRLHRSPADQAEGRAMGCEVAPAA